MARETRKIGIRTARLRFPFSQSAGSAIVRTAATFASQEFEKAADIKTQEARISAAALNFERDGEGNLTAPTLPVSEDGLLTPSIYDRAYTKMVSAKYLNQSQIDVAERLNAIATENSFDPDAYRTLAEGYVSKVTELAPDMLKPDINNSAQIKMVEHFNRIVRRTSERDHNEAQGVQLASIKMLNDDLSGYVESGASDEVIGAQMLKIRAAIGEGRDVRDGGFSFWDEATRQKMVESIDQRFALSKIIANINNLPDDPVLHAEALQNLSDFSMGEGTIEMVDALGATKTVAVTDIYPNPEDRALIAGQASQILNTKQKVLENLLDERLKRDLIDFYTWFGRHSIENVGKPLDMDRLYSEYDKADFNVTEKGYDDTLREAIRGEIFRALTAQGSGSASQWAQDASPVMEDYDRRWKAEFNKLSNGRDPNSMSFEESTRINNEVFRRIGNVAFGNDQTKPAAREVNAFYNGLTGKNIDLEFLNEMIDNTDSKSWDDMEFLIPNRMARIGIWSDAVINTIKGRLMDPEGMNPEVLTNTIRLARMFWDNKSFKMNMVDALGSQVGGALDSLFTSNGAVTAGGVQDLLNKYGDPNYRPNINFDALSGDDKAAFENKAMDGLEGMLANNNWFGFGGTTGLQVPYLGFNPLAEEITGLPGEAKLLVMQKIKASSGHIDPNDPDAFTPFINRAVKETMSELQLAGSKIGYSPMRPGLRPDQWFGRITDPTYAVSKHPPEYELMNNPIIAQYGRVPKEAMKYVTEDFQFALDELAKKENPGNPPEWIAGRNAYVKYSSIDSNVGRENQAVYTIIIKRDDGVNEDILSMDGLGVGNPVLFFLDAPINRYIKDFGQELIETSERNTRRRIDRRENIAESFIF